MNLDDVYAIKTRIFRKGKNFDIRSWSPEPGVIERHSEESHFLFLPDSVTERFPEIIPQTGNIYHYTLPPMLVQHGPKVTDRVLEEITEHAHNTIEFQCLPMEKTQFLGISLANAIPFYLMGERGRHAPRKFTSVTPGSSLIQCIREGVVTKRYFKKEDEARWHVTSSRFSPYNHTPYIPFDTEIEIHRGTHDKMIPARQAQDLVNQLKFEQKNCADVLYKNCGHVRTIINFAKSRRDDTTKSSPVYVPQ